MAGQTLDHTIEQQLETAKSVVVLWSEHSIGSEWVRNEAGLASQRDVLVSTLIDNVEQPLEFRRRHAADLTRWTGDVGDVEFQVLSAGITAKTRVPPAGRAAPARPALAHRWRCFWPVAAILGVILLSGFGAYRVWVAPTGRAVSVGGNRGTDGPRVVNAPPSEIRGINNPWPLTLGAVTRISLDKDQDYYLKVTEPVERVKIVLDMRRIDPSSILSSRLSVLDELGAVVQDRVIRFSQIDVGGRQTASWSTRQATRIDFKLLNEGVPADFWLTVRREPAPQFVPFFGSVVPETMSLGEEKSGLLDANEAAYYRVPLRPGEYRAVIDFSNAERRNTNIKGSLALLDADGGKYSPIIRFNEIDVSYRKVATFRARNDGPIILKVESERASTRYALKLSEAR